MSSLEKQFSLHCRALGEAPEREYRFAAYSVGLGAGVRQRLADSALKDWRFDFAWPDQRFAVEVEGGGWSNGRHNRGTGFADDLRKYHAAMDLGWTIYRCDGEMIKSGVAIDLVIKLLERLRDGNHKNESIQQSGAL